MPKIALEPGFGVGPLLGAEYDDAAAAKPADAADHGGVLAKRPIAGERDELSDQPVMQSRQCGRCGWRATWTLYHAVSRA